MELKLDNFRENTAQAVGDELLQANLTRFGRLSQGKRAASMARLYDVELARDRAQAVKDRSLADLPGLLKRLESNVIAAGGQVHWAADDAEARRIVLDIARERQVRSVVKGKSMTAEEIGLNPALEAAGIEVNETDLGEYIIQLAHQPPSHIIAPAIHLSRGQVADLFTRELGVERTEDEEELTNIARVQLRARFLAADMGITGANMAVADTGSIVLIENEGNIRFSTTAPPVHVAIMGLEKVVADLDDVVDILNLLPRCGAGQTLSAYASIITGPRREGESDGPGEFHLVILDNGRSRILADPVQRQALRCIRCGACMNHCPVYLASGGHAYGWVYPGPIGSVLTANYLRQGHGLDLPFASTLCGRCAEVCPVKIDLPQLLLDLRRKATEEPAWLGRPGPVEKLGTGVWSWLNIHPTALRAAAGLARAGRSLAGPLALAGGRPPLLPRGLARWARRRTMPDLARRPFSKLWPMLKPELDAAANRAGGRR